MNDEAIASGRRCGGFCRRGFFFPLILIALGVIFLLDQLNYMHAVRLLAPVVIIIFGLDLLIGRRGRNHFILGLAFLAGGVVMLMDRLGYWAFDIGRYWPVILIAIGLSLLFRPYNPRRRRRYVAPAAPAAPAVTAAEDSESFVDAVAVLGGYNRRITSQRFTGGRITAFLGGMQLDLTQAGMAGPEAVLDITAFLGGAELRVPNNWEIEVEGQPFLGGFNDETQQLPTPGAKRLVIRGVAFMGGVNIKN